MAILPALEDHWRDTLALVGAASRNDMEGVDAILSNANCRAVAGMLAGCVLFHLQAAGTDPGQGAASGLADAQRAG